jgi:hypothetical protein
MSAKGKGKVDNTASITSDNKNKKILIPTTITTIIKLKKDILIKVKESAVFIEDRTKFTTYKTSINLAVWADNKKKKSNKIIKTVLEQVA